MLGRETTAPDVQVPNLLLFDVAAMGHVCDDASAVDFTLSVEGSFSNLGTPGYHYCDL